MRFYVPGLIFAGVTVCVAVIPLAGPASASGEHWKPASGIGDHCIVGTWTNLAGDGGSVTWDGRSVKMHGGGGAVEKDWSTGRTLTSYAHAKPFYGTTQGRTLKMVLRGKAEGRVHFDKGTGRLRFEGSKLVGYRLRFTFKGKTTEGTPGPVPWYESGKYTCGANKYTDAGGASTRVSRQP
jgi:hypothetical protein